MCPLSRRESDLRNVLADDVMFVLLSVHSWVRTSKTSLRLDVSLHVPVNAPGSNWWNQRNNCEWSVCGIMWESIFHAWFTLDVKVSCSGSFTWRWTKVESWISAQLKHPLTRDQSTVTTLYPGVHRYLVINRWGENNYRALGKNSVVADEDTLCKQKYYKSLIDMKSLGIFAVDECMVSLNECDRSVFSRFVILAIKEDLCAQNMAVLLGRNKDSFLLSFLTPMPKVWIVVWQLCQTILKEHFLRALTFAGAEHFASSSSFRLCVYLFLDIVHHVHGDGYRHKIHVGQSLKLRNHSPEPVMHWCCLSFYNNRRQTLKIPRMGHDCQGQNSTTLIISAES